MPVIMVHTLELRDEDKMIIAQKYTQILADLTKVPPEKIYVLFNGYPLEGIATGGHLVAEYPVGPNDFNIKYTENLKKGMKPSKVLVPPTLAPEKPAKVAKPSKAVKPRKK